MEMQSTNSMRSSIQDVLLESQTLRRRSSNLDDRLRSILQGYSLNVKVESDVESVGNPPELDLIPEEEKDEEEPEPIPELPKKKNSINRKSSDKSSKLLPPVKKSVTKQPKSEILEILVVTDKKKNIPTSQIPLKKEAPKNKMPQTSRDPKAQNQRPEQQKSALKNRDNSPKRKWESSQRNSLPVNHRPTQAQILRDLKVSKDQERKQKRETLNQNSGNYSLMEFFRKRVTLDEEDAVRKLEARESTEVRKKLAMRKPTTFVRPNSSPLKENTGQKKTIEDASKSMTNTKVSFSNDPDQVLGPDWNNIRFTLIAENHASSSTSGQSGYSDYA